MVTFIRRSQASLVSKMQTSFQRMKEFKRRSTRNNPLLITLPSKANGAENTLREIQEEEEKDENWGYQVDLKELRKEREKKGYEKYTYIKLKMNKVNMGSIVKNQGKHTWKNWRREKRGAIIAFDLLDWTMVVMMTIHFTWTESHLLLSLAGKRPPFPSETRSRTIKKIENSA